MTNVIEIAAEEYFKNKDTDDLENDMIDGLIIEPYDPDPRILSHIAGEGFIKPLTDWEYRLDGDFGAGTWAVPAGAPITLKVIDEGAAVILNWTKTSHGQFDLTWTDEENTTTLKKTIVVESLW